MKKFLILALFALSACTSSSGDGKFARAVQEAADLYIIRHGAAQAKSFVTLGWEVFSGSRGNETCERVIRSLDLWPGNTVCRQNHLAGVGQVLFILSEGQKNFMRDCEATQGFEYKPGAAGTMPVYQATHDPYAWRHHYYAC